MSATRSATEDIIRLLIDDHDRDDYAISSIRMAEIIQGQMQLLGAQTHLPMEAVTSVALLAGTYDYTLTGVVGDVRQVIDNATGMELTPVTLDELVSTYRQDTAVPQGSSNPPLYYAVLETSAQLSRIRVAPTPGASGTLKVYYGIVPASLSADASTIPFSAPLLRVLERSCAMECVASMSREDRAQRMISADVLSIWQNSVSEGLRAENLRLRVVGSGTQANVIETDA